jgi:hypothetical protein
MYSSKPYLHLINPSPWELMTSSLLMCMELLFPHEDGPEAFLDLLANNYHLEASVPLD